VRDKVLVAKEASFALPTPVYLREVPNSAITMSLFSVFDVDP